MNVHSISGELQVFYKNFWVSLRFLQFKDVIKICSFFNFNYGTITIKPIAHGDYNPHPQYFDEYDSNTLKYEGYHHEGNENFEPSLIETIDCPLNATHPLQCKFTYSKTLIFKLYFS